MQGPPDQDSKLWEREQWTEARLATLRATNRHRAVSTKTGQYRALRDGTGKYSAVNEGTGQYRALPQRPPGMTRLSAPPSPEAPRAPRPQRTLQPSKRSRRRTFFLIGFGATVIIFIGIIAILLTNALLASSGPTTTAVDFLTQISSQNYKQAYNDLGLSITIRTSNDDFVKQAQELDKQYGPITDYAQVADSATNSGNAQSYTYTITRSKLRYPMRLTLRQDPQDNNAWKIVDYGGTVGPTK